MTINKKQSFFIAAFVVLAFSVIPGLKKLDPKDLVDKISAVVVVIGYLAESKKKKELIQSETVPKKIYRLNISFQSGVYGGVIGGTVSGIVMAIAYFLDFHAPFYICLKIIPYGSLIGCLFGGLIYLGRRLFSLLTMLNPLWANFFGCLLACIVAGTLSGMLGMWLFGSNEYSFIGINYIFIAGIIVAISLIFGALAFDYEGKIKYIIFSLLVALVLSSFITLIGYLLFYNKQIAAYLDKTIYSKNIVDLIDAGVVIGLIMGSVFGVIIGFTIVFYKYWRFAEKQQAEDSKKVLSLEPTIP
jgi:hypothetical protein